MFIKRSYFIILVILALVVGFAGGFEFRDLKSADSGPVSLIQQLINRDIGKPDDVDFSLFWEAWDVLSNKYVDQTKIDKEKMLYGAISGLIDSVDDPYTVFLPPKISEKFQEEISGSFGGVGIEIGKRNEVLTVISPIKDTPAYRAGIKAGERIIEIDGKSTEGISVEEAVSLIRGKKGTDVSLTIVPAEGVDKRSVTLKRESIKIPTVEYELVENGTIGYIRLYTFNQNANSDFKKAAEDFIKSGAKSLIVDLRNNPGGLLDSAINLAGWFLEDGKIVVSEEFRDKSLNSFKADGNSLLKQYSTIMLINGGSASASEILAGAVRDNQGARLVGEKSFGKGSVQELHDLENGSAIKITIAKWLTPNGISITDKGIEPDIVVEINPDDIGNAKIEFGVPGKDPQLDKAIQLLNNPTN